jgi:hypothetical protein
MKQKQRVINKEHRVKIKKAKEKAKLSKAAEKK